MNLKFCQINAENLFLLFDEPLPKNFQKMDAKQWDRLSTSVYENKSLRKTTRLASALIDINADVIMLNEVGGLESLRNFNTYFLNESYSPILIEGNSDRSIDVGFLIKKDVPFYYDLFSHKNKRLNLIYHHEIFRAKPAESLEAEPGKLIEAKSSQQYKFSRDCAELRFFSQNVDHPSLIILLTHLKSPLDPDRIDTNGLLRREAELNACIEIYNELKNEFPTCPIIFAGDFNGNASRLNMDREFSALYQLTDLEDIFHLAQIPEGDRHTFIQVKSGLRSEGRQIDFCFLPRILHTHLVPSSVAVYLYRDEFGSPFKKPTTLDHKLLLPSDHYPIVFALENLNF